jgi:hypothetical protein
MKDPYEDTDDEYKDFWLWMMTKLMPLVSRDWYNRMRGVLVELHDPVTGLPVPESLSHYLTVSDFAYIPVVIEIYGKRQVEDGGIRTRGRTKGQAGMTQKENVQLYIVSLQKMQATFGSVENKENVVDWGLAVFDYIDKKKPSTTDIIPIAEITVGSMVVAAALAAEREIRKMKKDDLLIPV